MRKVIESISKFQKHEQLLLLTSRRNLEDEEKKYISTLIKIPGLNWSEFLGSAFINRVNGVVYKNIKEFKGIPKYVKYFLDVAYREQEKRTKIHINEIMRVSKELKEKNIQHAFLKGAVLNTLVYNAGERISNDTDMMVSVEDIDKTIMILKDIGYLQGEVVGGRVKKPPKKEILFKRMNTYEIVPLIKAMDEKSFPYHEMDINFKLGNDATREESEELLKRSKTVGTEEYRIDTLPLEEFLLFLCIHHYREAVMVFKIANGDDLTLYKFMDIHHLISKYGSKINWERLGVIAKEMNRVKDVYYTLYHTEILYPETLSDEILDMFKPEDVTFLNEYRGRDNTEEVYTWKTDFIHRVFSCDRQLEAMENVKDENDRYNNIMSAIRN